MRDAVNVLAADLIAKGCELGEIVSEVESALEVRWNERPVFQRLMHRMMPGDHLIVERTDRLDRDDVGVLVCLDWIAKRGILLHALDRGKDVVDLNSEVEQIRKHVDALVGYLEGKKRIERIRAGMAHRKAHGLCYSRKTPYGYKKVNLPATPGQTRCYKAWVLDDTQVAILREIVRLRDEEGWGFISIGKHLIEKGYRTQNKKQWMHKRHRRRRNEWCDTLVRNAYAACKKLIAEGKIPPTPSKEVSLAVAAPKPRHVPRVWKGKVWMHRLLEKWKTGKNGAAASS